MCVLTGSVAGGITVGSLNMVHEFLSNFEAISSTNVIWQDMQLVVTKFTQTQTVAPVLNIRHSKLDFMSYG